MIDAPLALAFTAGMVAAFNPCGFALLPAYLSYYVGVDAPAAGPGPAAALFRALAVGAAVTAGFAVVFGIAGTLVTELSLSVQRLTPWLSILLGLGPVVLGAAMLGGFQPQLSLPKVGRAAGGRGLGAMFVSASPTPPSRSPAPCRCSWPRWPAPSGMPASPPGWPASPPTPSAWAPSCWC